MSQSDNSRSPEDGTPLRIGRRRAVQLAAATAFLPLLLRNQAMAQATGSARGFSPPSTDMVFRRVMNRHMAGGALLRVTRDFNVRFRSTDTGYAVEGRQIAARVEAPAALHSFARLEEQRTETGVFPLMLDRSGQIVSGPAGEQDTRLEAAVAEALRLIGDGAGEARQLIAALHEAGAGLVAQLPRDLFAPVASQREQRERVTLPWGEAGEVVMRFEAQVDETTGLMRLARRHIVTRLGTDERQSDEQWELFCA